MVRGTISPANARSAGEPHVTSAQTGTRPESRRTAPPGSARPPPRAGACATRHQPTGARLWRTHKLPDHTGPNALPRSGDALTCAGSEAATRWLWQCPRKRVWGRELARVCYKVAHLISKWPTLLRSYFRHLSNFTLALSFGLSASTPELTAFSASEILSLFSSPILSSL